MAPVKKLAAAILPPPLLRWVKRSHYLRVVRDFDPREEPDLEVVSHLVRQGDRVVDVGANIGIYTRFLSGWVGAEGHVFSIEPIPETFGYLSHSARQLGLSNVECWNWATSDHEGVATMQVPRQEAGRNFYMARIVDTPSTSDGSGIQVPLRTLDHALSGHGPIAFVKCDVEGHELSCVRGAREILRGDAPAWLVEVSDDPDRVDARGHALFALFSESGYRPYWYDGKRLRGREAGDTSVNYFFLQPKHLERLSERDFPVG